MSRNRNSPMKEPLLLVEIVIVSEQERKKEGFLSLLKETFHYTGSSFIWFRKCAHFTHKAVFQQQLSHSSNMFLPGYNSPISTSCLAEITLLLFPHNLLAVWHSLLCPPAEQVGFFVPFSRRKQAEHKWPQSDISISMAVESSCKSATRFVRRRTQSL